MNAVDIISKKRDGGELSTAEIEYFVDGYTKGTIPDYQASALLMAMFYMKLSRREIFDMTRAMRDSGDIMDLSAIPGIKVDKHSTGGVGDKTTLIVGPIAAACGVPIAKMSGRALGFTGGTLDKLEAIPGMRIALSEEEFVKQVKECGLAVIGQTGEVAPADKKIYALRDVTGTVGVMGLIASSIMSKKLASGADAIVLDVKCGEGALMQNLEDACQLARLMVDIGTDAGVRTIAYVTDMSQPLGQCVGNVPEVTEAIEVLKGGGPEDLVELAISLSAAMIATGSAEGGGPEEGRETGAGQKCQAKCGGPGEDRETGAGLTLEEARIKAGDAVRSGRALEKFKEFVKWQGGDPGIATDYNLMPQPAFTAELRYDEEHFGCIGAAAEAGSGAADRAGASEESGRAGCAAEKGTGCYVSSLNARIVGEASHHAGAGRERKEDPIDLSAGILLNKKIGDFVEPGDLLATVCGADEAKVGAAVAELATAYGFAEERPEKKPLILDVIE